MQTRSPGNDGAASSPGLLHLLVVVTVMRGGTRGATLALFVRAGNADTHHRHLVAEVRYVTTS
jgi:hypothetical protein